MNPDESAEANEATESLETIAESRAAMARTGRRPAWVDAGLAVAMGLFVPLTLVGGEAVGVAPVGVLIAGIAWFVLGERFYATRHGQLMDARARGARLGHLLPLALGALLVALFPPPQSWQPWYAVLVAVAFGAGCFAWLRWSVGYHVRRLAAGDYDPASLR
ncbi:hypothetical protein [Propionicimonas sp.]|uniref:hypothetical protein n=1 Tax=Propionicimonas sp. TaxID=1955623 RepID=UPI0039E22285